LFDNDDTSGWHFTLYFLSRLCAIYLITEIKNKTAKKDDPFGRHYSITQDKKKRHKDELNFEDSYMRFMKGDLYGLHYTDTGNRRPL
jgi:hypothetical protein